MAQPGHIERTVTIADSASLSDAKQIGFATPDGVSRGTLVAIVTPASLEGTVMTFQGSNDGTTFTNIYDADGTERQVQIGSSRWIPLDPADFASTAHLKVRTGTSGTPTTQTGAATITLIVRTVA